MRDGDTIVSWLALLSALSFLGTLAYQVLYPSLRPWRKLSSQPVSKCKQPSMFVQWIGFASIVILVTSTPLFLIGCLVIAVQ